MSKIWCFGDSFTAPFSNKTEWSNEYVNYKGYKPNVYGDILSKKFNIDCINNGRGGCDNYSIFEKLCDTANEINQNDIIIVGWTTVKRFRLVNYDKLNWETFIPSFKNNQFKQCGITKDTFNEILINRTHINYEIELTKLVRFINFAFKTQKIIHWRWDDVGRLKKYNTIAEETNNKINDLHYSEQGHSELSKDLIEYVNGNQRIYHHAWFAEPTYYEDNKTLI
jgi:hypothetical protein